MYFLSSVRKIFFFLYSFSLNLTPYRSPIL
nr:MAG TPA_asm: hypothetical protein [Caudoviricetes sp.]